jgi:hypothetical protein
MEAVRAAFYPVFEILQLRGDRKDSLTEIAVLKIVELAKAGELDPETLCIDVTAEALPEGATPRAPSEPMTSVVSASEAD